MGILEAIINFIIEASSKVGLFIADSLDLMRKKEPKPKRSAFVQLIFSIIGGIIISAITLLVIIAILYFVFKITLF